MISRIITIAKYAVPAAALIVGCSAPDKADKTLTSPDGPINNCVAGDFSEDAGLPTGPYDSGRWITADGKFISPAGSLIEGEGFFTAGLAVSDNGVRRTIAVVDNRTHSGSPAVETFDLDASDVELDRQSYDIGEVGPAFYGIAFDSTGENLFVSTGAHNRVDIYDPTGERLVLRGSAELSGFITGIALSPDDKYLYAVGNLNNHIYKVSVTEPTMPELLGNAQVGFFPYAIAISPDGREAYVSNWQGDSVSVVNLETMTTEAFIDVADGPEELVYSADGAKVYVACSDADEINVIDTAKRQAIGTMDVSHHATSLTGSWPTSLAIDGARNLLYAVLNGRNQVDIIDLDAGEIIGSIPTGWRPSRVVLSPDGEKIYITNAKGIGGAPDLTSTGSKWNVPGLIQVLDRPEGAALETLTAQTLENASRPATIYNSDCENVVPVPSTPAERSPIKHVVWIMKENKTYDEVLGDLVGPDGDQWHDPSLNPFGETHTPNMHSIARQFTNFVNYYIPIENSNAGHMLFTTGACNDFCDKINLTQMFLPSFDPGSIPFAGTIFERLYQQGIGFRNYGEVVSFGFEALGELADFIDPRYPFWNQGVLDVDKAAEIIREIRAGIFPEFIFISLPNDHTFGSDCGKPTPGYMVADNDAGLGMIVEAISKSPFWAETLIFVFQDDSQSSSGDHIDARRSLLTAISPWVKRGYTATTHYSSESIFKTTEMILGIQPLGQFDAEATPMYEIFTGIPDFSPYERLPNGIEPAVTECGSGASRLFADSLEDFEEGDEKPTRDLTRLDRAPGIGDEIWKSVMGDRPRPPHAKRIDE